MRTSYANPPFDPVAESDLTSERALYAATLVQIPNDNHEALAAEANRHWERTDQILRASAARRGSGEGAT